MASNTRGSNTAANKISTTDFNSRDAATLAAGATFQGVGEDVSAYARVGVSIVSDNATDGTLTMEVSRDGVNWGGPTRTWSDTRFAQPHMWEIVEKYFRIKYVNGSTEATNLAIQVQYSSNGGILLGHQLDETLLDETEAIVTRSVAVGEDQAGVYRNVSTVNENDKTSLYTVAGFTNTQTVHLDMSLASSTTTAYMLIDLSDTTNWKHTNTGSIVLEYMVLEVDPGTTFTGEVKLGYLKNVDATNGDFVTLFDVDMRRAADLLVETIDFGSHGLHCSDAYHFGPTDANNVLYQTDVNLLGPDGNTSYPSGDGDLVLVVSGADTGNGAVNVSVTLGYETIA